MSNNETTEFNAIKNVFEIIENIVKSFESKIVSVSHNHFDLLNAIAFYISNNVDDTKIVLKAEFDKYMKSYKSFCEKYSKFIIFEEACLSLSLVDKTDLKEHMGFLFNYKEDFDVIDRHKINKFIKTIDKFGRNVEVKYEFTIVYEDDYEKFKSDMEELSEKLKKDYVDSSELNELKLIVKQLVDSFNNYQISKHCDNLTICGHNLIKKNCNLTKNYLYQCVLKQQTNFVYEGTANQTTDCAICLEEFKNGANVTKLKCRHLFCTECIEKWLSNSITCPYCRQNPEF